MGEFIPKINRYTTHDLRMIVNVFLIETEKGVVVIDGATALSSSREIRDIIDNRIQKPLLAVLLTHGHPDHYIGVGEIINNRPVPIIATQGTLDSAYYQDSYKIQTMEKGYGDNFPKQRKFPNEIVKDQDVVTYDNVDFTINDLGACESDADSTWTIKIQDTKHVFVGDIIYNKRHSYLRDGHALSWLKALDDMLDTYNHTTIFHTGHGDDCGTEIIHWQKAYIQAFLYTLQSFLEDKDTLDKEEQEQFFNRMKSFLPDETIIFLMKYEPEETIAALRRSGAIK